jgi:hypothetical protein
MANQYRWERIALERRRLAVTLCVTAMLLMSYPLAGHPVDREPPSHHERIIKSGQSRETRLRTAEKNDRLPEHKPESELNEQMAPTDRGDFEKVLLTDYPGTYLLYVKLKDEEKQRIFSKYQQTGKIEGVREAVIEQVGR